MSVVQYLPGSSIPFTLADYKADLLKPYSKLYFCLCIKEEFETARDHFDTSGSGNGELQNPSIPTAAICYSASSGETEVDLEKIKEAVSSLKCICGSLLTNIISIRRRSLF